MLPEDALSFLVEYGQSQTAVTHKAGLVTSCYNSIAGSQTAKLSELFFYESAAITDAEYVSKSA